MVSFSLRIFYNLCIVRLKDVHCKLWLLLMTCFHILINSFSSADFISANNVRYPHALHSPFKHHKKMQAQETDTFVGRIFEYNIPESSFPCTVESYKVSEKDERFLPKWLWFDEGNRKLIGIPSEKDEGVSEVLIVGLGILMNSPIGYICGTMTLKLTVWGLKHLPLFAENSIFRVKTFPENTAVLGYTCTVNEPIILASLVLSVKFDDLNGKKRADVVIALSPVYGIAIQDAFVLPNSESNPFASLLESSHVVASGPGLSRFVSGRSTLLTWRVKCGVIRVNDPLFEVLQQGSQKWSLTKNISYDVVGWHVVSGFQKHHVKHALLRRRRNVVGGSTTSVYSTIPISRATIVTTRLKSKKTSYITSTVLLTRLQPSPTFSSLIGSSSSIEILLSSSSKLLGQINSSLSQQSTVNLSSGIINSRNVSTTSQLSSSKLRTFIQPSLTSTLVQRSTTFIVMPSKRTSVFSDRHHRTSDERLSSAKSPTATMSSLERTRDIKYETSIRLSLLSSTSILSLDGNSLLSSTLFPSAISSRRTSRIHNVTRVSIPASRSSVKLLSSTMKYLLTSESSATTVANPSQSRTFSVMSQSFSSKTTSLASGSTGAKTLHSTVEQSGYENSSSSAMLPVQLPSISSTSTRLTSAQSHAGTSTYPFLTADTSSVVRIISPSQTVSSPPSRTSVENQTKTVVSSVSQSSTPVFNFTPSSTKQTLPFIASKTGTATERFGSYTLNFTVKSSVADSEGLKSSTVTGTETLSTGFSLKTNVTDKASFESTLKQTLLTTSRKPSQFQTRISLSSSAYFISDYMETTTATHFSPLQTSFISVPQTKKSSLVVLTSSMAGTTSIARLPTSTFITTESQSLVHVNTTGWTRPLFTTGMTAAITRSFKPTVEKSRAIVNSTTSKMLSTLNSITISPSSLMTNFSPALLTSPTQQLTNTSSFSYFIKELSSTLFVTPRYGSSSIKTNTGMINHFSITFNESTKPLSFTGVLSETLVHSYTISRVLETSLVTRFSTNHISYLRSCTSLHTSNVPIVSIRNFTTATFESSPSFSRYEFSERLTSASLSQALFSQFSNATGLSSLSSSTPLIIFWSSVSLDTFPTKSYQNHPCSSRSQTSNTRSYIVSRSLTTRRHRTPSISGSMAPTLTSRLSISQGTTPPNFNQTFIVSSFLSESMVSGSMIVQKSSTTSYMHTSVVSLSRLPPFQSTASRTLLLSNSRKTFFPSPSSFSALQPSLTHNSSSPNVLPTLLSSVSSPSRTLSGINSSIISTQLQWHHSQSSFIPVSFSLSPLVSRQTISSVSLPQAPSSLFSNSNVSSFVVSSLSLTRSPSYSSSVVSSLSPLTTVRVNTSGISLPSYFTSRSNYQTSMAFSFSVSTSIKPVSRRLSPSTPSSVWPVIVQSLSPSYLSSTVQFMVVSSLPPSTASSSIQSIVTQRSPSTTLSSSSRNTSSSSVQSIIVQSLPHSSSSAQSTVFSASQSSTSLSSFPSVDVQSPLPSYPSSLSHSVAVSSSPPLVPSSSVLPVAVSSSPPLTSSSCRSVFVQSSSPPLPSKSVQSGIDSNSSPSALTSSVRSIVVSSLSPSDSSSSVWSFIGQTQSRPSSSAQYVFVSSSLPSSSSSSVPSAIVQSPLLPTPSSTGQSYSRQTSPVLTPTSSFQRLISQISSPFTISHSVQSAVSQRSSQYYPLSSVTSSISSPAFMSSQFKPSFSLQSLGFSSSRVKHSSNINLISTHSVTPRSSSMFSFSLISYKKSRMSLVSSKANSRKPIISLYPSTSSHLFKVTSAIPFSPTNADTSSDHLSTTSSHYWVRVSGDVTKVHSQSSVSMSDFSSIANPRLPSHSSLPSSSSISPSPTPSNNSPKLFNSFDLLIVTVGKVFSVQIPIDTFHDREDGNTRNLLLNCLNRNLEPLSRDSWLQFNSTTQTIYGVALKKQVKQIKASSEYLLVARDHDGNKVYDAFTIDLRENDETLAVMFTVRISKTSLEIFNQDLSNVLLLVKNVANYYGDKDESMIRVMTITDGSVFFTWSNVTVQMCNKDLISQLTSKVITSEGNVHPAFHDALLPTFVAEDIYKNLTGPCVFPNTTEITHIARTSSHDKSLWLRYFLPGLVIGILMIVIAGACFFVRRHTGVKVLKADKQTFKRRKPIILDYELEISTHSGKPIELPDDSLTPVRYPKETSLTKPDSDGESYPRWPSPKYLAPSYQRLPPRYGSENYNSGYNTPPPAYKLPPSYQTDDWPL